MSIPVVQVDAFTNRPFAGNPAAVCVLPGPANEQWMARVAEEMNLSETAFLYDQDGGYNLRWFTPTVEVELCGHATLAAAHVLWESGYLVPQEQARFHTLSGLLTAERRVDWIEMDFPAEPASPGHDPPEIGNALGVAPINIGKNRFDYIVEIDSENALRALKPDMGLLAQVPCRGVIVTTRSTSEEYDFASRFFAPAAGVPEDPVTGSAHCCLGPYWAERLGQHEFIAYQASARGGIVRVGVFEDRVIIGGQAVTVMRGELEGP